MNGFSIYNTLIVDTIDHSILLRRLSHSFGFTGSALMWVQSYLMGRSQTIRLGSHSSSCIPCSVGVPQGSSWAHSYLPFTLPLSLTSLNPTIYSSNNMLTTHNSLLLLRQLMYMFWYQLSNHVCLLCKPGSAPIA